MAKIKIELPNRFSFSTLIPVRITDINYGGHVGNDTVLSILHEARVQFLNHFGYQELNESGVGLIMKDVAIDFKKELFYGDRLTVYVGTGEFSKASFESYYKIAIESAEKTFIIAVAKTGMVYYDYSNKKIAGIPEEMRSKLQT